MGRQTLAATTMVVAILTAFGAISTQAQDLQWQVENGFGRVPSESMRAWALALGVAPGAFARQLLSFYDPELHRLLFEDNP